jgi:hypothetical protein
MNAEELTASTLFSFGSGVDENYCQKSAKLKNCIYTPFIPTIFLRYWMKGERNAPRPVTKRRTRTFANVVGGSHKAPKAR